MLFSRTEVCLSRGRCQEEGTEVHRAWRSLLSAPHNSRCHASEGGKVKATLHRPEPDAEQSNQPVPQRDPHPVLSLFSFSVIQVISYQVFLVDFFS